MTERSIPILSQERLIDIFGTCDSNAARIEKEFSVSLFVADGAIKITGEETAVSQAEKVVSYLEKISALSGNVTGQDLDYALNAVRTGDIAEAEKLISDTLLITSKGRPVKPRTVGQKRYIESIKNNIITFGVGPAGTGKTFLAVAMATLWFRNKQVSRIILTRPAVEAGERLGFLPGDLQSKIDPYLRPLYDALFEMMGGDNYQRLVEKGVIEVAPLAYMRGRTLDDSFIILDEAQNTTREQMKMFLTRLGNNSKAVVTGDITQIDLPSGTSSGLIHAMDVCRDIAGVGIYRLTSHDVVRNTIVAKIVEAYDDYDKKGHKKQ